MQIPKSIKLIGETITVVYDENLHTRDSLLGSTDYQGLKINLMPSCKGYNVPSEKIQQVYFHELVHWILLKMHKEELRKDEDFVDMFADLMLQAENSREGTLE